MIIIDLINIAFYALIIGVGLWLYFVPSLEAYKRRHSKREAIFVMNLFGGLIGLGWVVALVWCYLPGERDE